MSITNIIEDEEIMTQLRNLFFVLEFIFIVIPVLGFLNLFPTTPSISKFFLSAALLNLVLFVMGVSLLNNRLDVVRRMVLKEARDNVIKKTDNVEEEIEDAKLQLKATYFRDHVLLGITVMVSCYLIFFDGTLMKLFGFEDFHLFGFTIFRDLGIVGILLVGLYQYRNYAEDPEELLNKNLNNYKRVSATGRKEPQ